MSTIPASQIVAVNPGVLNAGGNALVLNGLMLTESTQVPVGTVQSFASAAAVKAYFGAASPEGALATNYFLGYDNSPQKPGALLAAQYPATPVAAYVRGGTLGKTLAQIQALSGTLLIVMDGYSRNGGSIDLSSATSFSSAASIIQTALNGSEPTEASFTASLGATFTGTATGTSLVASSVTGIISVGDVISGTGIPAGTTIVSGPAGGGAGTYITSVVTTASTASIAAASTVLDVTVCASPTIAVGQTLVGSGVTGTPTITAQISGTAGGVGKYRISGTAQSVASEAMTAAATNLVVTYDSVSGAFVITSGITGAPSTAAFPTGTLAPLIFLTSATGAVLSQGAAATTPGTFMDAIVQLTQNWVTLFTAFDPDGGGGNTAKLAFSAWTNGQDDRYAYACWDPDLSPTVEVPATSSLGYLIAQADYSGTALIFAPDASKAAFLAGTIASIDFDVPNGRTVLAFRRQTGLAADVTTATIAINLAGNPQTPGDFGNGYNFYGAYATANQSFIFLNRGTISGPFEWIDSYINQIWLNSAMQLALMNLLTQVSSIPYNTDGFALIEGALADPINAGLAFGALRAGVTLSAAQIVEVNAAAGNNAVAGTLQTSGWYLQILAPSSTTRQSRGSPLIRFFYVDGESVQAITLDSTALQ